jgi:hypothetical protein
MALFGSIGVEWVTVAALLALVVLFAVIAAGPAIITTRLAGKLADGVREEEEIAGRADRQHAAILRGDDHLGMYGRYPPAKL